MYPSRAAEPNLLARTYHSSIASLAVRKIVSANTPKKKSSNEMGRPNHIQQLGALSVYSLTELSSESGQ